MLVLISHFMLGFEKDEFYFGRIAPLKTLEHRPKMTLNPLKITK
jgi:hypothetical protein